MRFFLLLMSLVTSLCAQEVKIYNSNSSPSGTTPSVTTTPATSQSSGTDQPVPSAEPQKYTVAPGDSFWKISHEFEITVARLKKANNLTSNMLKPGQVLVIPAKTPSISAPKATANTKPSDIVPAPGALPPTPPEPPTPPVPPLRDRLIAEVKNIAEGGVAYNESYTPSGEKEPWVMDCSNTVRCLFLKVLELKLPRTASDQYNELLLKSKAWLAPLDSNGKPNVTFLREHLQVGDLLFWENTYKPERNIPVTHVMVYLGLDEKGQMQMAGSSSSKNGLYNRAKSGPDVYPFNPLSPSGGYNTGLFGWGTRINGRFIAYGRPL